MERLLTVLVPAFNEASTIQVLLDRVCEARLEGVDREILVVDDGSTDGTARKVGEYIRSKPDSPVRLVTQPRNRGKGAAIRRGIDEARGEFLVIQDADLEYDPGQFSRLLEPILQDRADVVFGSRFMGSDPHRILFFWHSIGNRFLTFLSNMFNNLNLTDMESCYKMFRTEILRQIPLRENRFGFEPEVTARVAKIPGIRIYEVGISYYGRTYAEGKKINWKDGFRAIWCIVRYGLAGRRGRIR